MAREKSQKPLRFAALIRVSSERQAKRGESLRSQDTFVEHCVAGLGGTIVKRYSGQEHATPAQERLIFDRLLADAQNPQREFDAVIVANDRRWSRDNAKSKQALEILRSSGVRFFIGFKEYDLDDHNARFELGIMGEIAERDAADKKFESVTNRIHRAKRGIPTTANLPIARCWNEAEQKWELDEAKAAQLLDIAEQYAAGASLTSLAQRAGLNHSYLCKVLRSRLGSEWAIKFDVPDLQISETVKFSIPPIAPPALIRKVHDRLKANRTTSNHGKPSKHGFLLSGRIFCAACGSAMYGQRNQNGALFYRHGHRDRARACKADPRPWVRSEVLEREVVRLIFNMMGNPAAIERATKAATPNSDRLLAQQETAQRELTKVEKGRERLLRLVVEGTISEAQSRKQLKELTDRERPVRDELGRLGELLANVPDPQEIRQYVERFGDAIVIFDDEGNTYAGGNDVQSLQILLDNRDDKKRLIESALSGTLPDGRPAGVYVKPKDAKGEIHFEIIGQLVRIEGRLKAENQAQAQGKGRPRTRCVTSRAYSCRRTSLRDRSRRNPAGSKTARPANSPEATGGRLGEAESTHSTLQVARGRARSPPYSSTPGAVRALRGFFVEPDVAQLVPCVKSGRKRSRETGIW